MPSASAPWPVFGALRWRELVEPVVDPGHRLAGRGLEQRSRIDVALSSWTVNERIRGD